MELKVGDKAPVFMSKNTDGTPFDSLEVVGKKTVVLYFYPKDNTSICTAQACSFRDQYESFTDLGAEVIGVSSDSVASHSDFSKKYKLPFTLLADENKKIRTLFGVPSSLFGLLPGRVTYVIDKSGIVRMVFNSVKGQNHITKALDFIKNNAV